MENLNIPVYRGKKINSDEYIEGSVIKVYDWEREEWGDVNYEQDPKQKYFIIKALDNEISDDEMWHFEGFVEIDPTTLSINFLDMTDSEGNKIFACLSESGKDGDICVQPYDIGEDIIYPFIYKDGGIRRFYPFGKSFVVKSKFNEYKVIGIQND